jgi:hypothetical protein
MTKRVYPFIAAAWLGIACSEAYVAWRDKDPMRLATVALYAGLAALWVGLARE